MDWPVLVGQLAAAIVPLTAVLWKLQASLGSSKQEGGSVREIILRVEGRLDALVDRVEKLEQERVDRGVPPWQRN